MSQQTRPSRSKSSSVKRGKATYPKHLAGGRSGGSKPGSATRSKSGGGNNKGRPARATNNVKKRRGADIDPRRFVNEAAEREQMEAYVPTHAFSDFPLCTELQRGIEERGYVTPTQIQDVAIEPVLAGRDVIGLANTGTGKTAAFVLPIIQRLQDADDGSTALIITPTRELAGQINDEWMAFARRLRMRSALCVGGTNINRQKDSLQRKPRVVIGTPGRLKDLMKSGHLRLRNTGILVLDEADRMLDMGFINDIRTLVAQLPDHRQTLCFSATITPDIRRLMGDLLRDPFTASVRTSETSDHIEQRVVEATSKEHKISLLTEMLRDEEFEKVIVFGGTKHGVQRLADKLTKVGLRAEAIHGNKNQNQRQRSLNSFKDDYARILVATDVASRGLDIPAVSHVINFDQPPSYDDYIHRIGRTGRAGAGGTAITFVGA